MSGWWRLFSSKKAFTLSFSFLPWIRTCPCSCFFLLLVLFCLCCCCWCCCAEPERFLSRFVPKWGYWNSNSVPLVVFSFFFFLLLPKKNKKLGCIILPLASHAKLQKRPNYNAEEDAAFFFVVVRQNLNGEAKTRDKNVPKGWEGKSFHGFCVIFHSKQHKLTSRREWNQQLLLLIIACWMRESHNLL